jgi:hypothetical protein
MCISCYEEAGQPKIVNAKVIKAVELIEKVYSSPDGGAGGYGHIVLDDWNIEDHSIHFCIEEAEKASYNLSEETRTTCIECLTHFLLLTENERHSALAIHSGVLNVNS